MANFNPQILHVIKEDSAERARSSDYDGAAICGKDITPNMEVVTITELRAYPIRDEHEKLCLNCMYAKWFGMALLHQL
jgi:hypothetical protein